MTRNGETSRPHDIGVRTEIQHLSRKEQKGRSHWHGSFDLWERYQDSGDRTLFSTNSGEKKWTSVCKITDVTQFSYYAQIIN